MAPRFLIPALLRQISELRRGERDFIEVSRLDSERDYVSVKDIACAFRVVTEGNPMQSIYNVGSGIRTSNGDLIKSLVNAVGINDPLIKETKTSPESLVACMANITRISDEFGWGPQQSLEDVIKEIINE
jgi:nucleoside-diphosphate-sugar epimerase